MNTTKSESMRAVVLDAFGGAEVLHMAALAKPQIGAEDVLVQASYAAVNPIDAKIRGSNWRAARPFSGCSWLGRVWNHRSTGRERSALAAWQALFPFCGLLAGLRVLIHGGAGGVGHVAVQLVRLAGAEVTATASADNRAFLTELGANRVVDYNHERIEDAVRDLDVVIDTRGGADYARLVKTLKSSGIIVSLLGREQAQNAPEALSRRIRTGFVYVQPDRYVETGLREAAFCCEWPN